MSTSMCLLLLERLKRKNNKEKYMGERIVRGYWDCQCCGRKEIDGLVDECPGCGRRKPENTKYYMHGAKTGISYNKSMAADKDILSDKELENAYISRKECDGNHKDWVCSYCNSLNNWSDENCQSCGSPKKEADKEYGMKSIHKSKEMYDTENCFNVKKDQEDEFSPLSSFNVDKGEEDIDDLYSSSNYKDNAKNSFLNKMFFLASRNKEQVILASIIVFFVILFTVLFFPYSKTVTITGFSWNRNIGLEEYKTVQESDWTVPTDGRVYDSKTEIRSYRQVLDHYETKTVQRSRQVLDHYETEYSYSDNGNGTFTEHTSQRPVYRTEYYTETYEDPVYRSEPVYDTKYYYDIERWIDTNQSFPSSGHDQNPYWNETYMPLKKSFRDIKRTEKYEVYYDNDTDEEKPYSEWKEMSIGDELIQKRCILGIIYNTKYQKVK